VPEFRNSQTRWGRAYVYLGSPLGLSTAPDWFAEGNQISVFGVTVAAAGDLDADGFSDIVVGDPYYDDGQVDEGAAFVYAGGDRHNGKASRRPGQYRSNGATPIAPLLRSDIETGFRLRALGRSSAGRNDVRLEWEMKPQGAPFNGTDIQRSVLVDPGPGTDSRFPFDETVTGLSEGTSYHWRARITSPNPYFPSSPWMSQAGNNITETKLRTSGCIDQDGDGYGALSDPSCASSVPDCNDAQVLSWGTPGPTRNLRFVTKTLLNWDVPADPGGTTNIYDTIRSGAVATFLSAVCVASDSFSRSATDPATPATGAAFFYLTRAQSACPAPMNLGSLGTNSGGVPRVGRNCP